MKKSKLKASVSLIILCWLVYACSYVGKVNYAANINQVMEYFGVDHATAGLGSTLFFFAYGIGQVLNGLLCKKYNIKWMILASLSVSAIANLVVATSTNFEIVKYMWMLNGISMSVLWPTLIQLLAETLSSQDMTKASLVMGTTVASGTLLIYGLSAIVVNIDFKLSFWTPAILFVIVGIVWITLHDTLVARAKEECVEDTPIDKVENKPLSQPFDKKALLLMIVVLGVFGVATNLIKDGLVTWIPSILKEQYNLDASFSIILTLALPMVGMFGNALGVAVHKKIADYVWQTALMFLISGGVIAIVIAGVEANSFVLTLAGFVLVYFLIFSCNSLITAIFPLFMKGKLNSGLIAGVLNGCCYLGSTISSYGLGAVADASGWIAVFWTLLITCVVVVVIAVVYTIVKNIVYKSPNSITSNDRK